MATATKPAPAFDAARIRTQLRQWQQRLLDLSKSNPLLGLNRSRVSKLQVKNPGLTVLFEKFVREEAELRMPFVRRSRLPDVQELPFEDQPAAPELQVEPGDLEFDASPLDLMRRLRRLYDNARTTAEERGVTTLYLTFGTLHWKDDQLGTSVSPLWMVPCQLTSKGPNVALRLSLADEEMQLNPALEYYLRERHKISLPQIPEEPEENLLLSFLETVQQMVREQRWEVNQDAWLSTFTFESLVIYQDLKAMADTAIVNPIIAAFARAQTEAARSEALGDDLDSLATPAIVPVPALPTDSSQLEALTCAANCRNVVVHGPPGTGKSQTISNLIADALGRNKKVLFVSAKMAALNVVHDRLKKEGLERFCLEAHSTKAGKAKIIDELRRTLEAESAGGGGLLNEELEGLLRIRQQLNGYVRELHKKCPPLGLTVYQGVGKVAKLSQVPDIRAPLPWSDPLSVPRGDLDMHLDALADLGALADVFDARLHHPWRGLTSTESGVAHREAVEADLRLIANTGRAVLGTLPLLVPVISSCEDLTFAVIDVLCPALEALSNEKTLPQGWWGLSSDQLNEAAKLFETAGNLATELQGLKSEYDRLFSQAFQETRDLLSPIRSAYNTWYRRLMPSYRSWRTSVVERLKPGAKAALASLRSYFTLATRLAEIESWIKTHSKKLEKDVGLEGLHNPEALTNAAHQFQAAALIQRALRATGRQPREGVTVLSPEIREATKRLACLAPARDTQLTDALKRVDARWPNGLVDGVATTQATFAGLTARAEEILASMSRMHEWILLQRALRKCEELGLGPFVAQLGSTSAKAARTTFERRFYTLWTSTAIQSSKELADFNPARHHDLIRDFGLVDDRLRRLTIRRTQVVASEPAHRIKTAQDTTGNVSEVGTLRYELQKKKRVKPLRKLFAEMPHVLQALKPCMLMSPISVSTYLKPGAIDFDLVVFDEASQLPTPEAVPAILRAKQVVVAGDSNQLPPTTFFEASLLTEEELEEEVQGAPQPLESLLNDCVAIVPVFHEAYLRWHYRSRDERLIKFSNHYFYDNRLITFPSAFSDEDGRGVRLVYVPDGVWDRGRSRTNRREARCVAQLVVENLERCPERSLGVVAMNSYQREAIEDAINEEMQNRPDLSPLLSGNQNEPFFVKSLENVQGDERDTMIISVGYGKDASGALTLNFGPLNMEGGWRRLNVLVTRAKWQTILVTSMRSQELQGVNPQNRGAVALKNFIAYGECHASLPPDAATITQAETNDFEDAVYEALIERGLRVDQQVGASRFRIDLAVRDRRDPSRYLLGIECDGATYHSSRTARDRDLLRQQILRDMGWRLHRLWSTEWFHARERAIQSVLESIEQAEATPIEHLVHAPADPPPDGNSDRAGDPPKKVTTDSHATASQDTQAPVDRKYPAGVPYQRYWPVSQRANRDLLLQSENFGPLARDMTAIVEAEGPIHETLLMERLKEMHGIERAGLNVQANISAAICWAMQRHGLERRRDLQFIWKKGRELRRFRVPGDGVKRPIELVPREEIELAVLHIIEDQFGMIRDHIPSVVGRIFGFERVHSEVADVIREAVDDLIERGRLRTSGPSVYISQG